MDAKSLANQVSGGEVLQEGDPGFDDARAVWNARFDRTPELIVRCRSSADVKACVALAGSRDIGLSVKSGGHSYAANTVAEGSLLIDLSPMKEVRIDSEARTATVEPGVACAELDAATLEHSLAVPLPTVSSVGVAGATLGGGSGYLSRKYGLTLDNLVALDVVTADGRELRASEDENGDLFWAIRGAGANFGVATAFHYRLNPVKTEMLAGQIVYRLDRVREMLRFFRDFMRAAPDEFQCYPFTFRVPPIDAFQAEYHGQPVLDFVFCHAGRDAARFVQPLRELGEPILDIVGPLPYTQIQQSFDAGLPKGQRYYSKGHYMDELSDGAIDTIATHVPEMKGEFTVAYLEPLGGAIAKVDRSATAFAGRDARYSFHVLAGWINEADDSAVMSWARSFHNAMRTHATGGVYVNLLADDEPGRVAAAYGGNYERLRDLKRKWDPDNLFRANHNIGI